MDVFELHKLNTGKLEIIPTIKLDSKDTLTQVYTPNVGKICLAIKDNPELLKEYTIAGKTIAVISNGSAVLGFGDIGPKAALPVMEGKAVIFKELAGINAYPLCLDLHDADSLIQTIKSLALNFAAINLEDIAAPLCFEVEKRLNDELDIPVMHDDQHGTAIVLMSALMGALKLFPKQKLKIVISGAGAAGTAITKLLLEAKTSLEIDQILVFDSQGLVSSDRKDLNIYKQELAKLTGQTQQLSLEEGLNNADVFIGVSKAGLLSQDSIKKMNRDSFIFAMANPVPEIMPDEAYAAGAAIVGTGRSDLPNQINNALAYPGIFKGLVENQINKITPELKLKAAKAIFEYHQDKLNKNMLLPDILDKNVPVKIASIFKK